jgi:tetratricopeptide (TPR) repeat protein
VGLALVKALQKNKEQALLKMKEAQALVKNEDDQADVYEGKIHLVYLLSDPKMLPQAEEAFKQLMKIRPAPASTCFYMALIYKKAFLFDYAFSLLERVLKTKNPFVLRAYNEIENITKIKEAQPITNIAKEIALKETITRADMAALLVHELHLDQLIKTPIPNFSKIKDISAERFAKEIIAISPLEINGLSVGVDGYFAPDSKLTKASLCQILEDIVVMISKNKDLRKYFRRIHSPYKDLKKEASYYNACILSLVKGFILPSDRSNKLFGPLSSISGLDALLALKRLGKEVGII